MRKVWRGYHNNLESIVESFEIIQEYKVERLQLWLSARVR